MGADTETGAMEGAQVGGEESLANGDTAEGNLTAARADADAAEAKADDTTADRRKARPHATPVTRGGKRDGASASVQVSSGAGASRGPPRRASRGSGSSRRSQMATARDQYERAWAAIASQPITPYVGVADGSPHIMQAAHAQAQLALAHAQPANAHSSYLATATVAQPFPAMHGAAVPWMPVMVPVAGAHFAVGSPPSGARITPVVGSAEVPVNVATPVGPAGLSNGPAMRTQNAHANSSGGPQGTHPQNALSYPAYMYTSAQPAAYVSGGPAGAVGAEDAASAEALAAMSLGGVSVPSTPYMMYPVAYAPGGIHPAYLQGAQAAAYAGAGVPAVTPAPAHAHAHAHAQQGHAHQTATAPPEAPNGEAHADTEATRGTDVDTAPSFSEATSSVGVSASSKGDGLATADASAATTSGNTAAAADGEAASTASQ